MVGHYQAPPDNNHHLFFDLLTMEGDTIEEVFAKRLTNFPEDVNQ
jgi:hypothetical protein